MSREFAQAALHEALAISHELVRAAEHGDGERAQVLNAKRIGLLREFLDGAQPIGSDDVQTLQQISTLNRIAIEDLQMCQRATMRELESVNKGKQAVQAYGLNKRRR